MRILYVTTVGCTMNFFKAFIRELLEQGHQVDLAANYEEEAIPECFAQWGCRIYALSCTRSPLSAGNLHTVRQLKRLALKNQYDIIHCHTPIAAACTRLACASLRKKGPLVLYTAHGFHFYKGAPLQNWLLYYPVEWICSFWTDALITINHEDLTLAERHLHAKHTFYVPGVGIDTAHFLNASPNRLQLRRELAIPEKAVLLLSVGELNENKNQSLVIRALAETGRRDIFYALAGTGPCKEALQTLAVSLGIEAQVRFLGYRTDTAALYKAADLFVHPSYREGLPVAVIEAMAAGLPCLCSRIRGNTDLIDSNGGAFFDPHCQESFIGALYQLLSADTASMSRHNAQAALAYDVQKINASMLQLYTQMINGREG